MNIKSKNKLTKCLTLPVQCIKLLVMRRALLTLAIAMCFIATSSAQPSRKKPQYKSTAKQTEVVKEQPKKLEPSKAKKEQPQKKSETRHEAKQEAPRESKSKETDRFIDSVFQLNRPTDVTVPGDDEGDGSRDALHCRTRRNHQPNQYLV